MSVGVEIAAIAVLGALGALIRLAIHEGMRLAHRSVYLATVWSNALGSFGLGLVITADWGPWAVVVGAGLFGAITTLSTLAVDMAELLKTNRQEAIVILSGHVLGALLAFGIGAAIGGLF